MNDISMRMNDFPLFDFIVMMIERIEAVFTGNTP